MALALFAGVLSFLGNHLVPLASPLLIAIVLGVLARNLGLLPARALAGLAFTAKFILRLGVILLGFHLSLLSVARLGWAALAVVALTVSLTFAGTLFLGRLLRVGHAATVLTATGTAICGAAAVAGMSSVVVGKDQDEVDEGAATAIASVTLYGLLLLFLLPALIVWMGLPAHLAGIWTGSAIHEVGQVTAAAQVVSTHYAAGQGAQILSEATLTKLARVVLLAPLVALVGILERRRADRQGLSPVGKSQKRPPLVPPFVLAFFMAMLLRTFGESFVWSEVFVSINYLAVVLLTMAMFAMGAGVHLKTLLRTSGKALLLGLGACLIAGTVSLLATLALA
ncbi:putative sulfate exporter family transporter [Actinomycetaceae bacterium TAE3-ERU4]|nr:putative sulfate exporter family transporter [Actinomycetaceae bacterium TAE3-ERU4]